MREIVEDFREFVGRVYDIEIYDECIDRFLIAQDTDNKIPFQQFWDEYDKKSGRKEAEKFWTKLTFKKQEKALAMVPAFKQAFPDKKFRVDPIRYLRNERYEDDLVYTPPNTEQTKQMYEPNPNELF